MENSISILGSTGSIGTQTLDVAEKLNIKVRAISGNFNINLLEQQARKFNVEEVCCYNEECAKKLKISLADTNIKVTHGMDGLVEIARNPSKTLVTAVSGAVGLMPTLEAIYLGKRIALANKETLVCAGEIVMKAAEKFKAEILPVDSEHSAIYQCLKSQGADKTLRKILLTGSGGPFRGKLPSELEGVTPAMAVKHPNWSMGAKISVDSATMMNKGLEFMEAMHLFAVSADEIEVVIHPESIIHSMVEFRDGAIIAQLGTPSMKTPIQYALTYPTREQSFDEALDITKISKLNFYKPNFAETPCLKLAIDCAKKGGISGTILSASNEIAVARFLKGSLSFNGIYSLVSACVEKFEGKTANSLEEILEADKEARIFSESF